MAATARKIPVTDDDFSGGGGSYNELEVPGDYEAVLSKVEDYDKRQQGKSHGWIFFYGVETPSGKSVEFKAFLSFNANARWKLIEVLEAHDVDVEIGLNEVDPNALVEDTIGVHIDFPRDGDDQPTSKYREISQFFSLAPAPEGAEASADDSADPVRGVEDISEEIQEAQEKATEDLVKFGEEEPDII